MRRIVSTALVLGLVSAVGWAKPKVATVIVKVTADSENPGYDAGRAMDGNPGTMWHTQFTGVNPACPHELVIDLGKSYPLAGLAYTPRTGGGNGTIKDYEVYVADKADKFGKPLVKGKFPRGQGEMAVRFAAAVAGRYVKIRALSEVNGRAWTSIAELRLLSPGVRFVSKPGPARRGRRGRPAAPPVPKTIFGREAKTETDFEYLTLQHDLAQRRRVNQHADQVFREESLILDTDRDPLDIVLRRTAALLADLQRMPNAPDLAARRMELTLLAKAAEKVEPGKEAGDKARFDLFARACGLRRRIALANPLLNFDKLLFIKRHRSTFNHMCDQYYAVNAVPGGGVYVLENPFGAKPTVRDVLADAVVQRGRLKGKKLEGGSYVAPDLSYDGTQILFAYTECVGERKHYHHTDPSRGHWAAGRCYHLFKVNVDGTGLEQLTDGTWNDFDPCWLPNGRVAFITERRGGYLRCGRTCPTYTLFDMAPDGSDIRCLSPHETNEWHPSVTYDGRIIYTRWDYVDRHGCTAHMPWITTLDGRDSRAVHGNFAPRGSRPDMELDCRAIPGSSRFVATAAPHHGQAYGSIVMVDPNVKDDDAMGPVRRVTPEVGFPESQGGSQVYGTPWPLSENYYLCVYDPSMQPGVGRQGRGYLRGNYGIYLVDAFGNKELIYRDAEIACLSPMPLRPRRKPPVMPSFVSQAKNPHGVAYGNLAGKAAGEGTIAVMDVYDAEKPWPKGTEISALRIYHIIPMSVPSGGPPHEIGLRLPSGRDSVILARYVIGTVPVEKDGSAYFTAPANVELFFQALDKDGLAVQSMRSSTYMQKGERLTCQGCHDPRSRTPLQPKRMPLALRRKPSVPKPDVDGSNPFSYPRLVQPVLDKYCVACHTKNKAKHAPNLGIEPRNKRSGWYASYSSLAPKYGFWNYHDSYRTTPGQFGARASKLYQMLSKGHHKLKLSPEDMHRLTLWLDSCSIFYGVYEREGGPVQVAGKPGKPTLE